VISSYMKISREFEEGEDTRKKKTLPTSKGKE
jgi:hypothetical protein